MIRHIYSKFYCCHGASRSGVAVLSFLCLLLWATPALAEQPMPSTGGSVLNILLLALIAYFLVRTFRRRMNKDDDDNARPGNWTRKDDDSEQGGRVIRPMDRHEAARQMWGHLSSDKPLSAGQQQETPVSSGGAFDEAEFLEGAKLFFSRFQQASDSRDFDDLKVFLSESVYADAVADAQRNPAVGDTEIMLLTARLMEVKNEGDKTLATVFYDAQLRMSAKGEQPMHVRAVWEFSRDDMVDNGLWTLEQINKVDQ